MSDLIMRIKHPEIPPLPTGPLYNSRESRSMFVAKHFRSIIRGKVLDVGSSAGGLRAALHSDIHCVGLDLYGQPDIRFNLDSGFLPFSDRSFDVVICTDVLEHLEQIHFVFDELIRVCRGPVIVSLPNCWQGSWRWLLPGKTLGSGKYYSLPEERPKDRHRWFFNSCEAVSFLWSRSRKNEARILWLDVVLPQSFIRRTMMCLLLGPRFWVWAPAAVWAVVEK